MATNRSIEYHQQWIGYLNPTGLVFSPQALDDAQSVINEGVISEQKEFLALVTKTVNDNTEFTGFENILNLFINTLDWRAADLNSDQAVITQYSFSHPQFDEVVFPTYVARVNEEKVILIQEVDQEDFDKTANTEDAWNSSPHFKFERLLREKQVPTGIIFHKAKLRLIFAPRGESSGYIDFPFKIMYQPSGRLVFSAFRELLSYGKVFNSSKGQSLIEVLELSRKYQAQVSIELSGQVLTALYELLRGFQTANDDESGKLLENTLKDNPQLIYEGLLTTLLRMVFIMYAEDRNLLATDEVYQSSYSLAGLYERLRQDEAQNPDTMDSRYGAWAHLISLSRLIYDGAEYDCEKGKAVLPARHGHLFDPNIYLFLEGRVLKDQLYNKAPNISDGVVFRVLKNLLILNGERISYRTLDVEQIGSVYETMMGFELSIAEGKTIALKPAKSHGAPLPINLDSILSAKDKAKKFTEISDVKLTDRHKTAVNASRTIEELEQALDNKIDRRATPFLLPQGAMVLAPSEARRKSGSHYTPRELTEPIVRAALEPIIKNLGEKATPEKILDLKICDPAMGSGAFLVEACRQLSEKLVESWATHKIKVPISADEDELLHARKLIAQKCLYGVDKNHMAVNLAKLSLWLVTLAKDHSFSFLDHNLKNGDTLVGLSNKQIMGFDYSDRTEDLPLFQYVKVLVKESLEARDEIRNAYDDKNYDAQEVIEEEYQERLEPLRLIGNLAIKCFFDGTNEKSRIANLQRHSLVISNYFASNTPEILIAYCKRELADNLTVLPFHWELEFPEVFIRENKGFDSFIGNPPFLGGRRTTTELGEKYRDWLAQEFPQSSSNADLVSFFFRKAFCLTSTNGAIGFISTNTIFQGDSRRTALDYIYRHDGYIFNAHKRIRWPGDAAVVVAVIHITKKSGITPILEGKIVDYISPFLTQTRMVGDPYVLNANSEKSFQGCIILGMGFTFDDRKPTGVAGSISDMENLISTDGEIANVIKPYLGGDEVNNEPTHSHHRYAIDFTGMSEAEVKDKYGSLYHIIKETVLPDRINQKRSHLRERWWQYGETRPALYRAIRNMDRVLVLSCQASVNYCITFVSTKQVFANSLAILAFNDYGNFAILQSTIHELWARFFASSMKDDLRYTPSDCFETFPFPKNENIESLEDIGKHYFEYRAILLVDSNMGMTEIYNKFHNPDESDEKIVQLREKHKFLDLAVLNYYGWSDIVPTYDFILDYEESENENDVESNSSRRKPFRYKFTPDIHDEILSRLMEMNKTQHEEEVRLGLHER